MGFWIPQNRFPHHRSVLSASTTYNGVDGEPRRTGSSMTGEATRLLELWSGGDADAGEQLWPLVYDDLRRMARRLYSTDGGDHTLDPTALVHEAWMQIRPEHAAGAVNRGQYLAFASRVMRSLLVDHVRMKGADKRGGRHVRVTLSDVASSDSNEVDVLVVHELLEQLSATDEELGRIAELRIFGGLNQEEIAAAVGIPKRTLERRWRVARAWLMRELER